MSESSIAFSSSSRARSGASRYTRVAIALHWLTAVLVLSTIPLGFFSAWSPRPAVTAAPVVEAGALPKPPPRPPKKSAAQQTATNVHKTIGIVILLTTMLRIGWRLTHTAPPLPAHMPRAQRVLARTSHVLFYVLLVVMPLTGWWVSSAVPDPFRHAFGFGFVDIPFLPVPRGWPSAVPARLVHVNLAWVMVGLAALHIVAALKHRFVDRDDVLQRMLPRRASSPLEN